MNRSTVVCVALFAMFVRVISAKDAQVISAKDRPLSDKEMRSLVRGLVSPNRAPEIEPPDTVKYPAKYDHKAQGRVLDAWLALQRCGPRAFPFLFHSLGDERYSFTDDGHVSYENWTVGRACRDMIECELQPRRLWSSDKRDPRHFFPTYVNAFDLDSRDGAKKWWKTHSDKTLRELQIEVLEWVIPRLQQENTFAGIRKELERDLARLRSGKQPLVAGVPWSR